MVSLLMLCAAFIADLQCLKGLFATYCSSGQTNKNCSFKKSTTQEIAEVKIKEICCENKQLLWLKTVLKRVHVCCRKKPGATTTLIKRDCLKKICELLCEIPVSLFPQQSAYVFGGEAFFNTFQGSFLGAEQISRDFTLKKIHGGYLLSLFCQVSLAKSGPK